MPGEISEVREIAYINNSATSYPKPEIATKALFDAMAQLPEMSGRGEGSTTKDLIKSARVKLARFLGCPDPNRLIFTNNSTSALNIAIHGLFNTAGYEKKLHAVTTTNDHNSVLRPLRHLEKDGRAEVTIVSSDENGVLDPEKIISALRPETSLLAVNHLSNVVGTIAPLEALGAECRKRDIAFLVDASQSAGILDINAEQLSIDFLAITGHKYLYGPTGIGALYISDRQDIQPIIQGGTGVKSDYEFQPEELPIRFEAGTGNYVGIVALDAAREFVESIGLEEIRQRITHLRRRCEEGLTEIKGIRLYGPPPEAEKGSVISLTMEGYSVADLDEILRAHYKIITRSGLHCAPLCHKTIGSAPAGTLRASFSYLTPESSVDYLLEALREIASS